MREYIVTVGNTDRDYEGMFIGFIRKRQELIRCKYCQYFDGEYCHSEDLNLCLEPEGFSGALFCPPEDFYCGYAKGKE